MGCVAVPNVAPPTLPSPFSLEPPALPPVDLSVNFCCRFELHITPPPLPIPPITLLIPGGAAILVAMNEAFDVIDEYIDEVNALVPPCPFN